MARKKTPRKRSNNQKLTTYQRGFSTKSTTRLLTNKWVNIDLKTRDIPYTRETEDSLRSSNLHRIHNMLVSNYAVQRLRKSRRTRNVIKSPIFSGLVELKKRL